MTPKQNYKCNLAELGKEFGPCSDVVKQRLRDAGFEHILMKKPGEFVNVGKNSR